MRRVALLTIALLALMGTTGAEARVLTATTARTAVVRWSLNHGADQAVVAQCERVASPLVRCIVSETGEIIPGSYAEEVPSVYLIRLTRRDRLSVEWRDYAWGFPCTTVPGLEPQCRSESQL